MMTADELKRRSVINVRNAADYGCPVDFSVDVCEGRITHIIVSPSRKTFSLKAPSEMKIPWCDVVRIGDGAILVDVPVPEKCDSCEKPPKKKNPFF